MKFLLSILAIALMTASAQAQTSAGQGGGRQKSHHQEQTQKSATPKADDKAYNAALRGLPNKPYDPLERSALRMVRVVPRGTPAHTPNCGRDRRHRN